MDLKFEASTGLLTVSLSESDSRAIVAGETLSQRTDVLADETEVTVRPRHSRKEDFKSSAPIGDEIHARNLGYKATKVLIGPSLIDIDMPRTIPAANIWAAEMVTGDDITHEPYSNSAVRTVRIEYEEIGILSDVDTIDHVQ